MESMSVNDRLEFLQMKEEFETNRERINELERENRELRKELTRLKRGMFNERNR